MIVAIVLGRAKKPSNDGGEELKGFITFFLLRLLTFRLNGVSAIVSLSES